MQVTTVGYGRVRGKAKSYPYFQVCLYEYRPRKSDGVVTARFIQTVGDAYRSKKKAEKEALNYADNHSIAYKKNIRHGSILNDS